MRRLVPLAVACALVSGACDRDTSATSPSRSPRATPSPTSPGAPQPSAPASASASPSGVSPPTAPTPSGAVLVETDAEVDDLDVADLVPARSDVTGRWIGTVDGGDVLVLAAAGEGDAFSRSRALWLWTRRSDLGGWLGVELARYPVRTGVLTLDVVLADVTGDADDDALVFALTGGTGACGAWTVHDLATAERVFARDLCDATIDPATDPVGLLVDEAIFRPDDAHCCPSARRQTLLTYVDDGDWTVERRDVVPLT